MDELLNIADEEWSPEFLDSIFENNTDLLSVFDDPHKISEITSDLMEYESHHSPLSSSSSGHSDVPDLEAFLLNPSTISSSASDSGLSSDNLDFETSPDYEPLSPTLSSPGPSISERGGQNSPPRFQKVAKVSPTVHKKFNTRSSTAAAAAANNMTAVSPRLVQAVVPNNIRAVTGVKRGASSVATSAGGPKAKEVKVYRMQPNNNQTSKKSATVTPPTTTTGTRTTGAALSNGVRKILINTIDMKDLRTIKIINANTLKNPHLKLAAANLLQQSKQGLLPKNAMLPKEQYERQSAKQADIVFDEDSSDEQQDLVFETKQVTRDDDDDVEEEDSDDEDEYGDKYPSSAGRGSTDKLVLTAEERRLLSKEGISLPSNYPLTKHEERELKRIRRKIRNKISAQDSRKRKKEYVDGLEERVKQCTDENQSLMKRIKMLQGQNHSLVTQMKKLQSLLSKTNGGSGSSSSGSSSTAQPTTCLMVLLLSMALIAAPNLKLGKREAAGKESELAEAIQESLKMQQNRRNLLYDNLNLAEDEASDSMMVCNEGDFIAENENFIESFYNRIGVGSSHGNGNNKKPTAIGGKKGGNGFMDLDLDDTVWRATTKKSATPSSTVTSGFGLGTATALNAFSGANGRNMMMGLGGGSTDAVEKMDNVLIMELRNNLMVGANEQEGIVEDGGKRINNSMHVHVHHQQRGSDILFQD